MSFWKFSLGAEMTRAVIVLAITQTGCWGMVNLPPVIGREMAETLGLTLPLAFAGTSIMFVIAGLVAPLFGRAFVAYGAQRVMATGSVIATIGFAILACAPNPAIYFLAWIFLGFFCAATLTIGAYIFLNELAGPRAATAITLLLLVMALSTSLFWPLTAFLTAHFGWRVAVGCYAVLMISVMCPLLLFALPSTHHKRKENAAKNAQTPRANGSLRLPLALMVGAIALNGFACFGFEAVTIEVLKALSLSTHEAIAVGSAIGVLKILARLIDLAGRGKWDGLATATASSIFLLLSIGILLIGGGAIWSIALFAVLYGFGGGAYAISRATMPLVFFDRDTYTMAMSHIAMPLNLVYAAAPPLLAAMLSDGSVDWVLWTTLGCCVAALGLLTMLTFRRPPAIPRPLNEDLIAAAQPEP